MTIAKIQTQYIGARIYTPEGPLDTTGAIGPFPTFSYGEVAIGDAEAEFIYLKFAVSGAPVTLNQGDLLSWDQNFNAVLASTSGSTRGQSVGSFFLGGRRGESSNPPFSFTFAANGTYGIWVQRSGIGLVNCASTVAAATPAETTSTAGQINAPASHTTGAKTLVGLYVPAASVTFTANTVSGSNLLTNISAIDGVYPNQSITGTGIAANSVIQSINGVPGNYTITLNNNATATGSAVTMTVKGYLEAQLHWPYVDNTN